MTKIAVVGSANVDLIARVPHLPNPGETVIANEKLRITMGGKGANQAVGAAKLGADVTFIARLGQDAYAETCLKSYQVAGVETRAIQKTPDASTGVAMIGVDEKSENSIIVIPGANMMLTPDDIEAAADEIQAANTLLLQLEIPLATNLRAAEIAHEKGKTIILNPAPYQKLPRQLLEKISVITPNITEAAQMLGKKIENEEELVQRLLGMGPQSVVITMGSKGALVGASWGRVQVSGYTVKAVDSTGAGDAFNAALAVALGDNKALDQAAVFANAAATIATTRAGAQPSLPTYEEVEEFLAKT